MPTKIIALIMGNIPSYLDCLKHLLKPSKCNLITGILLSNVHNLTLRKMDEKQIIQSKVTAHVFLVGSKKSYRLTEKLTTEGKRKSCRFH